MCIRDSRSDLETTILRTPGMMYQERPDGAISNLYQLKMLNKSNNIYPVKLELMEPSGRIEMVGEDIVLRKQGMEAGAFFIIIPSIMLLIIALGSRLTIEGQELYLRWYAFGDALQKNKLNIQDFEPDLLLQYCICLLYTSPSPRD